jgi:hypothetical protein
MTRLPLTVFQSPPRDFLVAPQVREPMDFLIPRSTRIGCCSFSRYARSEFFWLRLNLPYRFCWISSSTFLISRSGARERRQLGGRASLQVSGSSFPALVSHLALKFVFRRRLVSAAEAAVRFGFQLPFSFHCRRFFIHCEIFLRWSKQRGLRFLRLGSHDELILPPESAGAIFFAA